MNVQEIKSRIADIENTRNLIKTLLTVVSTPTKTGVFYIRKADMVGIEKLTSSIEYFIHDIEAQIESCGFIAALRHRKFIAEVNKYIVDVQSDINSIHKMPRLKANNFISKKDFEPFRSLALHIIGNEISVPA